MGTTNIGVSSGGSGGGAGEIVIKLAEQAVHGTTGQGNRGGKDLASGCF